MTINSTNAYIIDLSNWGITQGIPSKPYTIDNYKMANNNVSGINNALSWAYQNGYDYVVLPKGSYAICYPNPINTQPNMTIDFNYSTLKVIYDSDNRSPYDNTGNPIYKFGGNSIQCTTPQTHIINLILIGDRIDRSWSNSSERSTESTYGVIFGAGAHYSTIRNCNISYYMGDAISLSYSPYNSFSIGKTEFGGLDNTTGAPTTGTTSNTVRSVNFIQFPSGITSFSMIGLGYAPATSIPSGTFNVYFYKTDNSFIMKKVNVRTRDIIQIPKNATQLKLTWEGNGTVDDGLLPNNPPYWAILIKNGVADHVMVENNEIHRCHRGGLTLGTNNALIRNNYFHDTGAPDGMDIDGLPQFPDFTRYAINTEDNVGQNCHIVENIFDNSRIAIALRGEYNEVSSNEFRNCPIGIQLYYQRHITVTKNYFYYSNFQCFNYYNFDRDWIITDNIFNASQMTFAGSGTIATINNNHFHSGSYVSNSVASLSFKNNTFDNSHYTVTETQTLIDGCSFVNGGYIEMYSLVNPFDKIIRCTFNNGSYIRMQNSPQVIIRGSVFNDGYVYYSTQTGTYTLINCTVNNISRPLITNPKPNAYTTTNVLQLKNCNISLGIAPPNWQASHSYKIGDTVIPSKPNGYYYQCFTAGKSGTNEPTWSTIAGSVTVDGTAKWNVYPIAKVPLIYAFYWGELDIENSTINFNLVTNYSSVLADFYGIIKNTLKIRNSTISASPAQASYSVSSPTLVLVDNTFTSFSLTNQPAKVITYDSSEPYIRIPITGNSAPGALPQYIGQVYVDTSAKKIYQAAGTSALSDWIALN
ncbi:right-handed parallel beta-helix repeat-containing protein [Bacillus sp. EB600]|uniref:right-handed parallel beta-helix repeat-containing protein n=1 Tax=Bacillus sp. EB600 TaxID=2806345 RepID=UPI00210CABCD|nr:right-handed parallel beta-helix repeat-containing protein [Bacillus sp. EB600]MCQ6278880.1 hypothetical protein [Bacillus sp. EB600]